MKKIVVAVAIVVSIISCDHRLANFEGGAPERESMHMIASPAVALPEKRKVRSTDIVERRLIKNGTISFSTNDIAVTRTEIEKICKEFNAYISSDEQQKLDGKIQYEQVIRIPAGRFDAFIKVIENLGNHVDYRNITTQDVTAEFVDLEARLKTKKELEIRYHQLFAKASKVDDMLAIEEQIANVRTEIESMEGRLNLLTNKVSYSTLTLTYNQVLVSDFGFASQLMSSFAIGWKGLLTFMVGVVAAWPFILILSGAFWLISRWLKRINVTRHAKAETT